MSHHTTSENYASDRLPAVISSSAINTHESYGPARRNVAWGSTNCPATPIYMFTSHVAPARSDVNSLYSLDLRDKKKLRCIWLAPDEGDKHIVRPPRIDSMHYAQINASMYDHNIIDKIKRTDHLSVQLEISNRYMDATHTYEQSAKMLLRCIRKREEIFGAMTEEIQRLRSDYDIRCAQLVALCMCGAQRAATGKDNTAFLLLRKAEELTARDGLQYCKKHVQRAAVYQNIANYYRKQKKYQAALQAAQKAVRINEKLAPNDRFAITYFLQACLYGLVHEHSKAGFMYTTCLLLIDKQQTENIASKNRQSTEVFDTIRTATLHNLAIEWASLNMPDQARDALVSAMELGLNHLTQTHPIVVRMFETYKILRENFLFQNSKRNATSVESAPLQKASRLTGPIRPTSPSVSVYGTKRPAPSRLYRNFEDSSRDVTSPRLGRMTGHQNSVTVSEDRSSVQLTSRRPTSSMSATARDSPRVRVIMRPLTTPETFTNISGYAVPPGATRSSNIQTAPDRLYSHALRVRYSLHKERVLEEARAYGRRRRAALKIQSLWTKALVRHRALQRKTNAATLIQSVRRMQNQKSQECKAAAKIQSYVRRHLRMKQLHYILPAAAIMHRVIHYVEAQQQVAIAIESVVRIVMSCLIEAVTVNGQRLRTQETAVKLTPMDVTSLKRNDACTFKASNVSNETEDDEPKFQCAATPDDPSEKEGKVMN
ncbi:Tetratricopeptide repeat-containing domain [Plasmopara halstedii]|uniref:Tetratricopeptide repeat-containing domain n=1 Tax=Plasmopara halstedii TaxID=4781 RepID=A0A0P1A922_PLAHL|nr:Tetratricopeptide repeat-containing domain [Plasmopara halstedii]CEG37247.1 Tetratricopeptide repeat-containing domain [Plasmopara halstedii]|eukprot:XP_024573616.1 Tetratricopeptide repeat-containing domain [Plasmopara halstedii]